MKHTPDSIKKVIKEKVEGIWVPRHDERGHHYEHTPTGTIVDSTTTKIGIIKKPHLERWKIKKAVEWLEVGDRFSKLATDERNTYMIGAQEAYTEFRDEAGGIGTRAHDVAEHYIKHWIKTGTQPTDIRQGFLPEDDPRAVAAARSVEKFFNDHPTTPIASELLVGSVKRKAAGTLDLLAFVDGILTLVDLKTSNNVDDSYAEQLADYLYSFKEMTGIGIKKAIILWLSKDYDKFKIYEVPDLKGAFKAYNGISAHYDWSTNGQDKLIEIKKTIKI